ncbi:hypothetical protein [Halobacterium noricense]|uniref:hypothetical protein n=1 Tax=Halobacterium noricense TaxID=223182 RepID=UPI001E5EC4E9|nr:hypothetical protein [Halobacterium noricense]UHH25594.1 hypothetical protein LT974_01305 [Halobacterium noricense]
MNLIDYLEGSTDYDDKMEIYEEFAQRALERDDLEEYYASQSEEDVISSLTMFDYAVQDHAGKQDSDGEGGESDE